MAIVSRVFATAVMAAAVIAGPVIQDRDVAGSDCGTACNVAPPYDGAVCVEGKREDGSCYAAWLNSGVGQLSIDGVVVNRTAYDPYRSPDPALESAQPIHVGDDDDDDDDNHALSKRIEFAKSDQDQNHCKYATRTCHDRGRGAAFADCRELLRVSAHMNTKGTWSVGKEDLVGRRWFNLMESGTCVFAIGHPNAQAADGKTRIGNFDVTHALTGALDLCVKKGGLLEVQGMSLCSKWPLEYWITNKNRFSCCGASLATDYLDRGVDGEKRGSG